MKLFLFLFILSISLHGFAQNPDNLVIVKPNEFDDVLTNLGTVNGSDGKIAPVFTKHLLVECIPVE